MAAQLEQLLRLLGQRYVLFYPVLRHVTGSANAALMLGHLLYWTRTYMATRPERQGWFWQTSEDWKAATGLSRHEQDTAREALRQSGCVEERLIGVPARMHYRLNLDVLGQKISEHLHQQFKGSWTWDDKIVRGLLGTPIAFLRVFADITGSTAAALYLSDLLQQRKLADRIQSRIDVGDGWLDLPLRLAAERVGRSTKSLRTARKMLLAQRLIEERSSKGVQPRLYTKLNLRQIVRILGSRVQNRTQVIDNAGMAETYIPDVPKAANWNGGSAHSRCAETGKLDVPKPANKIAALGTSIRGFTTTRGLTPSKQPLQRELAPVGVQRSSSGSGVKGIQDETPQHPSQFGQPTTEEPLASETQRAELMMELILPPTIPNEIAQAAQLMVCDLHPKKRQEVLDEWVGQLARGGKVSNQLGYLGGIVRNALAGTFVPTLAVQVRTARERAAHNAAELERRRQQTPIKPVSSLANSGPRANAESETKRGNALFKESMRNMSWRAPNDRS
ncbi:hypothetical protein [Uliginosibacterium gangwonense]|uniref:hypothetical protein n=1 Tax=Uliginosibacterium gangwonense TaxID=392736 RepID=UPI00039EF1CF|nr:hypothetical protein [Uliginosibacterium gangwonense]